MAQRHALRNRNGVRVAARFDQGRRTAGVAEDVGERVGRKPRVERHRYGAGAHRPEEELDEFQPVADQHGDPLAGRDAEPRQHGGDPVHPGIKRPIRDLPLAPAEQVNDRNLVGGSHTSFAEEKPKIAPTIAVSRM